MNKEIRSLYRLYRPKQFSEVVGQEHVTRTLTNQIIAGKVGHAYLFCGTRGTGKTSAAKIFANAVNCLGFKEKKAICGVCDYCKRVGIQTRGGTAGDGQPLFDVFELDAASNNRVEDVRELIERVKYPPIHAKYKVYIVDEVHMFSASAFNAFLKTLEEPPSHVIFILCTTEAHKLLPTIQSRCLRFDFRSVSVSEIEKVLLKVFKAEKIESEPEAVRLIAEAGAGSVRDALSFAETAAAYAAGKITTAAVNEILGSVDKKILAELLNYIVTKNVEKIISSCDKIFSIGRNASAVVKDMLEVIKQMFISSKDAKLMGVYKLFSELEMNIKTAIDTRALFEGACLIGTV